MATVAAMMVQDPGQVPGFLFVGAAHLAHESAKCL